MKEKIGLSLFFLILPVMALQAESATTEVQLHQAFRYAVKDASLVKRGEIARNMIAINKENPQLVWNEDQTKILVASWKSQSSYDNFMRDETQTSSNEDYVIWVTTVPQVQQLCQDYLRYNPKATAENVNLRLKQYLGLHYTWEYDLFVEMWVDPAEMFRPCVDPEINDSQCELDFSGNTPVVKNIQDYPSFYKNLYFKDFRSQPGVPWTGLGYTYDWGSPLTDMGASEFILIPGATYEIKRTVPTMDYCYPIGETE